jgi:hypothetical protein
VFFSPYNPDYANIDGTPAWLIGVDMQQLHPDQRQSLCRYLIVRERKSKIVADEFGHPILAWNASRDNHSR